MSASRVRDLFEALLAGIDVVAEADEDRAERLLAELARALHDQTPAIKWALRGEWEPQWSAPIPCGSGTIRIQSVPPGMLL